MELKCLQILAQDRTQIQPGLTPSTRDMVELECNGPLPGCRCSLARVNAGAGLAVSWPWLSFSASPSLGLGDSGAGLERVGLRAGLTPELDCPEPGPYTFHGLVAPPWQFTPARTHNVHGR